jgi:hypothetical protein
MITRRILSITLIISLLLSSTNSFCAYSWQDLQEWTLKLFNVDKEAAQKFMPFAIFAVGAVAAGSLYYWMSKKYNIITQQPATPSQPTDVFPPSKNIKPEPRLAPTLRQLQVYSQSNPDGGGGASCGYQTLFRAMQVVKSKSEDEGKKDLNKTLMDSIPIAVYFGNPNNPGEWRKEIIARRKDQELKKTLHEKFISALSEGSDAKAKDLYKSALGFLEDIVVDISRDPKKNIEHYAFTDEDIQYYLKKSLEQLKNNENEKLISKLQDPNVINQYFDFEKMRKNVLSKYFLLNLPPLVQQINNSPELQDDFKGEWLSDGEVEYLWEHKRSDIVPKTAQCGFKAIANFDLVANPDYDPEVDEVGLYVKDKIKPSLNIKQQLFQVFALGTMRQGSDTSGSRGHWYPLVMHQNKEGRRHYYIMDSAGNNDRTKDTNAWKVINLIEKK